MAKVRWSPTETETLHTGDLPGSLRKLSSRFSFRSIWDNYCCHRLLRTCTIRPTCFHPSFPPSSLFLSPSSLCGRARSPGISMHPKKYKKKKKIDTCTRRRQAEERSRVRRGRGGATPSESAAPGNAADSCLFERRRERLSLSGLTGRQPPSPLHTTGWFFLLFFFNLFFAF